MDQSKEIERLIGPAAAELGYELVRIKLQGNHRVTLQIMAERQDRRAMQVEDCARLSRTISTRLDEADPIASEYTLEVSSPGIDRPLMKLPDYERFAGHEAQLDLDAAIAGHKRLRGVIAKVEDDIVSLEIGAETIPVPFSHVRQAKLILTDRLIEAVQDESAAADFSGETDAASSNSCLEVSNDRIVASCRPSRA